MTSLESSRMQASEKRSETASTELARLRKLLLGSDLDSVNEINRWRSDKKAFSESIADSITEAMEQRDSSDHSISELLVPTIERAIGDSVKNNPEPLADALYPVMGPAIRRSIAETMAQTLENFNQVLQHSFSPKALKWRAQAAFSGRSFAEIALLNSLDYRVEQVFLIHRETSLLLQHVVAESVEARDADMVSSMLSAIQDFVSDSFSLGSGDTLNTLQLGELTVCVVAGPKSVIAAVVRGNVPDDLRRLLHEASESVHQKMSNELDDFGGDSVVFEPCRPVIEKCLVTRSAVDADNDGRAPVMALAALGLVALALLFMAYKKHQFESLKQSTVALLNKQPGILVTDVREQDDSLVFSGLRDPAAKQVSDIVSADTIDKLKLETELREWYSLEPSMTSTRIAGKVDFPDDVQYSLDGATLTLAGSASYDWFMNMKQLAPLIPGVNKLNYVNLTVGEPPQVPQLQAAVADPLRLKDLRQAVESHIIYFAKDALSPDDASIRALSGLRENLRQLHSEAQAHGFDVRVDVLAYSDTTGSVELNQNISDSRAENVVILLDEIDRTDTTFTPIGMGEVRDAVENIRSARHVRMSVFLAMTEAGAQMP